MPSKPTQVDVLVKVQGGQQETIEILALDKGDNSGRGEKWLAFIYVFKIEPKRLLKNWMWDVRKRGIEKYSKILGTSVWLA